MRAPLTFHQAAGANHIYLTCYKEWLARQAVTAHTSRAYHSRLKQFLLFLDYANMSDSPLGDAGAIEEAISLYLDFLKNSRKDSVTINATINALNNFCRFMAVDVKEFKRERCYDKPAKLLTRGEEEKFLHAAGEQESARDKALALILFHTGLRIGDCAALGLENIGGGGTSIYSGSGAGTAVKIHLNKHTSLALKQWLEERNKIATATGADSGLWLTKEGKRLTISGIAFVIKRISWQAKLAISVETLRRAALARATAHLNKDQLASRFGGYISAATVEKYGA